MKYSAECFDGGGWPLPSPHWYRLARVRRMPRRPPRAALSAGRALAPPRVSKPPADGRGAAAAGCSGPVRSNWTLRPTFAQPMAAQMEAALSVRIATMDAAQSHVVALSADAALENAAVIQKLFPTFAEVQESFRTLAADNAKLPMEERVEKLAQIFGEQQVGRSASVVDGGATLEQRVCTSGVVTNWVRSVLEGDAQVAREREENLTRRDSEPETETPEVAEAVADVRAVVIGGMVYAYVSAEPDSVYVFPNSVVEERVKDPAMVFDRHEAELVEEMRGAVRYDGVPMYGDAGPAARGNKGGWLGESKLLGVEFLRSSTEMLPAVFPRVDFNGKLAEPMWMDLAIARPLPGEVLFGGDTAMSDGCDLQSVVFPLLRMAANAPLVFTVPAPTAEGACPARSIKLLPFCRGPSKNETWHCPLAGGTVLFNLFPPCPLNHGTLSAVVQETMRRSQAVEATRGVRLEEPPAEGSAEMALYEQALGERHATVDAAMVLGVRVMGSPHWPTDTTLTLDTVKGSALVALRGVTARGLKTVFTAEYDAAEVAFKQVAEAHVSHSHYNVSVDTLVCFCWQQRVLQLQKALAAAPPNPDEPDLLPPMMRHLDAADTTEQRHTLCKQLSLLNVSTRNCVTSDRRELHEHIASCAQDLCMLVLGEDASKAWRRAVQQCTPLQRAWVTSKHVVEAMLRLACQEDVGVANCTEATVTGYLEELKRMAEPPKPPEPAAAAAPEAPVDASFEACAVFAGRRAGREFKTGPQGMGYYATATALA
jgi:hypothetical protein